MKINKKSLTLENDHIYLRPLFIDDITDEYVNQLNDPEVNRHLVDVRRNVQTWESVQSLGRVRYGLTEPEKTSLKFRRSLYVVQDMRKGDILTSKNVRAIRPGLGLLPKYNDILIGKKIIRDVKKGTPVTWDLFGE